MRNSGELSKEHWIICPDMRGHGRSQHTRHGYHVARLAQDLREIITGVIQTLAPGTRIHAVGCSIGAAVLWTYVELFTDDGFTSLVFVDQAPLQDRSVFDGWGPNLAHYGCYDEATKLAAQSSWSSNDPKVLEETYSGLVTSCFGYRFAPSTEDNVSEVRAKEDEKFFTAISRACDGTWLAKLLGDHTGYDHREAIELISKPVLVMAGKRSGCFSVDGMMETVRRAQKNEVRELPAETVVFESGHWLFWEEAEKFNRELAGFVTKCQN